MSQFDRAMAALDLSDMDQAVLRFLGAIAPVLPIRKTYFIHVIPDFSVPQQVDLAFQQLFDPDSPIDERVEARIREAIDQHLGGNPAMEVAVEVVEGKPYERLTHWAAVKHVDLLVVGHKVFSEGSGITPKRVARKVEANVLFVPFNPPKALKKVVVPIDFSDNALRALRLVLDWAARVPDLEIQLIYIVDMPPADYYIKPYGDKGYRALLLDSARQTFADFVEKHGLEEVQGLEPVFIPNDFNSVAAHLDEWIKDNGADLVVMGAQGHSAFENLIYGSVTERFVQRSTKSPILIVR